MEEKDLESASGSSVVSDYEETNSRPYNSRGELQEAQEDNIVEPSSSRPQEEEEEEVELITPPRIVNLQRELQTLVTNIQTAADAKESMRRTELEEARRVRLERLENDVKSCQEAFEKISRGWLSAKEKVIPQELQTALNQQQQLCSALIEDKKALINDLLQELKTGDDRYVKELRIQAEELDLMMERMEDQIKTLSKAYKEELAQIERVCLQESEIWLMRDRAEWDQSLKNLWDKESEWLTQRKKTVDEYEETINDLMFQTTEASNIIHNDVEETFLVLERENQEMKAEIMLIDLKQLKVGNRDHATTLSSMKSRLQSLQKEIKDMETKQKRQEEQLTKKKQKVSDDYKRSIEEYECLQKKIKHFSFANAKKFESMWLMLDEEVKQMVEKALHVDKHICQHHLGLPWERPPMPFMEITGPIQPQKQADHDGPQSFQARQALQHSQRTMDASVGPRLETDTESTDTGLYKDGSVVQSESGAEVLPMETLKKVMELLCDESGFLLEDKLLQLLAPLEKEERPVIKLGSLLCALGLDEGDVPKLALFLLKYRHQQREQSEESMTESSDKADEVDVTSELIDPNHVVPALKSFIEQRMRSRRISAAPRLSFQPLEERDTSQDEAYWKSMANVISEEKLKLWESAEESLKQYLAVLTDISELNTETQSLEQQNAELRMLLQQSINSGV